MFKPLFSKLIEMTASKPGKSLLLLINCRDNYTAFRKASDIKKAGW
jgi:hypothetical protein